MGQCQSGQLAIQRNFIRRGQCKHAEEPHQPPQSPQPQQSGSSRCLQCSSSSDDPFSSEDDSEPPLSNRPQSPFFSPAMKKSLCSHKEAVSGRQSLTFHVQLAEPKADAVDVAEVLDPVCEELLTEQQSSECRRVIFQQTVTVFTYETDPHMDDWRSWSRYESRPATSRSLFRKPSAHRPSPHRPPSREGRRRKAEVLPVVRKSSKL